ncbi:nitroreductase/quinone reductase family protein [Natronoglomus mannanivorans]|uniref:Nitroreductase family deazaflavin-dependent oxidoreductase n=1 Tax=Natronoglomus mannanivorans TaxID=2979990 RepID=A0AAP2YXG2_9EURY|nr:nitroreductase family deazaflavin-dependent oxidoreductase [Halobacteria archaeon AArc-xg1-1]
MWPIDRVRSVARRIERRVVNPILLWILHSPAHWLLSGWVTVLTYEGRRSGRSFATPLLYRRAGDRVVLLTPADGTNWWKNFCGGHPLRVLVRGRQRTGTGTVETDEDVVLETVRWVVSPMRCVTGPLPGRPIPSEKRVRAMADEFVVVIVSFDDE